MYEIEIIYIGKARKEKGEDRPDGDLRDEMRCTCCLVSWYATSCYIHGMCSVSISCWENMQLFLCCGSMGNVLFLCTTQEAIRACI
jgi:hypothetical protein